MAPESEEDKPLNDIDAEDDVDDDDVDDVDVEEVDEEDLIDDETSGINNFGGACICFVADDRRN
jgi:hypothetical protein